ncbi:hypothetical protein ACLIA0_12215 [Bacillaceae bacterium W0354]
MKKLTMILYIHLFIFVLVGCVSQTNEEPANETTEDSSVLMEENEEESTTTEPEESNKEDSNITSDEESDSDQTITENIEEKDKTLAPYSSKEIEYARIWLQLGPNPDIEGLYVQHIPAGQPLNPDDETSASYPEGVIQLSGSRLIDGSITYSGNGDGTINIYNVPKRWDGNYPAGEEFYKNIINNTELVYVDPGEDEKIIELIKLIKYVD